MAGKLGLARLEALLESLNRDLNLENTTLTNVGASTFASTVTVTGRVECASTLAGNRRLVEAVTENDNLNASESHKLFVFTDAAATLTLPDSGAGDIIGVSFEFLSAFQGSAQKVVCADTTNEKIIGGVSAIDADAAADIRGWPSPLGTSNSSVNMNSVAQGSPGSRFKITCIQADRWVVEGLMIQSGGSEANPFATS